MSTRNTRRKKLSPEPVPKQSPPSVVTLKRKTRSQKENEESGKFVKYPQDTPVKTLPTVEPKSTRRRAALKENALLNNAKSEILSDKTMPPPSSRRKRKKDVPIDFLDENTIDQEPEKKLDENEAKENYTNGDSAADSPEKLTKKTKKRGKKKFKQQKSSPESEPDETKKLQKSTELSSTTDSFHSASGSPDKNNSSSQSESVLNSTVTIAENTTESSQSSSSSRNSSSTLKEQTLLNTTFEKVTERRSSRISLKGNTSEDLFNTTIDLVDSPAEKSVSAQKKSSVVHKSSDNIPNANERRSLVRQGTFTKESSEASKVTPEIKDIGSPVRVKRSLPAPGSTPYHPRRKNTRSAEKSVSMLNLTHSLEKRKSSLKRSSTVAEDLRTMKVMFCSPVLNQVRDSARKSKIIKSSMKGSNKSFVYEENSLLHSSRKRSFTHGDAEAVTAKRKKLANEQQTNSSSRLTGGKQVKVNGVSKEPTTPNARPPLRKSLSETKPTSVRSKLPNFAALHQKAFNKMESLSDAQQRKAQRAKQMLFSSGSYSQDGRRSSTVKQLNTSKVETDKKPEKQPDTTTKSQTKVLDVSKKLKPTENTTYTRFGFKLPTENPFSIPSVKKNPLDIPTANFAKEKLNSTTVAPKTNGTYSKAKLNGTLPSLRREKSKQALKREVTSASLVEKKKKENRDILKGVRTNRRFELQMKSRNIHF